MQNQTNAMKTTEKNYTNTRIFPIACFVFLLLNISLDCRSVIAAGHETYKNYLRMNSTILEAGDSSINGFLLASYILHQNQSETEETVKLESWMNEPDSFLFSDFSNENNQSYTTEAKYSFEDWMSNPDLFGSHDNPDPLGGEVQTEEEIKFESWMINTSSWVDVACQ